MLNVYFRKVAIESDDPKFDQETTTRFLSGIGGDNVELVED